MKAAVVQALGAPPVVEDRPDPEPGPGQVRRPVKPEPPLVPGHEGVGLETLCEQQINAGYGCDGGYAEKMPAGADFAQPVPEGVGAVAAAPLTCAGATVDVADEEFEPATELGADLVIAVNGSIVGTRQDLAAVDEAIGEVPRGQVKARIVFDLGTER